MTFEQAQSLTKNIHMTFYVLAAEKLGIEFNVVMPALFTDFNKDGKSWRIHKALTPINNSVATALSSYKNTCNRFLDKNGIPVPKFETVENVESINKFMEKNAIGKIVIKPTKAFGGSGVSILPNGIEEINTAYSTAYEKSLSKRNAKVQVEEFIEGENYRLMVLGDKVIAAALRLTPLVIGNGKDTIKQLVESKNLRLKEKNRSTIIIDKEAEKTLSHQNMSWDSIPEEESTVKLRFNSNMSCGGSTEEYLEKVHPHYKEIAVKATKAIGLKLAGVDFITPDISDPNQKFVINEVNHDPGLRIHYMPDKGEPTDVAIKIQKYILDNI